MFLQLILSGILSDIFKCPSPVLEQHTLLCSLPLALSLFRGLQVRTGTVQKAGGRPHKSSRETLLLPDPWEILTRVNPSGGTHHPKETAHTAQLPGSHTWAPSVLPPLFPSSLPLSLPAFFPPRTFSEHQLSASPKYRVASKTNTVSVLEVRGGGGGPLLSISKLAIIIQ